MNEAQSDDQIKKAIENGEVSVDEQTRTYEILVDPIARMKQYLGHKARLEYLGYTAKPTSLDDLRSRLTDEQRCILNTILRHYLDEKYEADPWIRSGILYHFLEYDESIVHAILKPLGGTVVYENPHLGNGKRYVLTSLGILLTDRGEDAEIVLARYLDYVRQQYIDSSGYIKHIVLRGVAEKQRITSDQLYLLRRVLPWFSDFFGGGGSIEEHGLPLCTDELIAVKDVRAYVREHEFCKFDPSISINRNPLLDYTAGRAIQRDSTLTVLASPSLATASNTKREAILDETERQMSEPAKVFISYARKDKEIMQSIKSGLEPLDIELWVDQDGIRGGDSFPNQISKGLEWCDTFLLIWSTNAERSEWIKRELGAALALQRRIIPCLFDNTRLPALLSDIQFVDFKVNIDEGLQSLIRSLGSFGTKENLVQVKESTNHKIELGRSEELGRQRRLSIQPIFCARLERIQIGSKHLLLLTNIGNGTAVNIKIAQIDFPAPDNKRDATPDDILSIKARDIAAYKIQGERDAYIVFDFVQFIPQNQSISVPYKVRFKDEAGGKGSLVLREFGYGGLDFLSLLDERHTLRIDFQDIEGNQYHQVITKAGGSLVSGKVSLAPME